MTRNRIAETLCKTIGVGLVSGIVGGWLLYLAIIQDAQARVQEINGMSRASHMCGAGSAAFLLAILSLPAGALFGLCLGGFFLWRKAVAARRPLP